MLDLLLSLRIKKLTCYELSYEKPLFMLLMLAGTNSRTYLNKHIALATGLLSMYDLLLSYERLTKQIKFCHLFQ